MAGTINKAGGTPGGLSPTSASGTEVEPRRTPEASPIAAPRVLGHPPVDDASEMDTEVTLPENPLTAPLPGNNAEFYQDGHANARTTLGRILAIPQSDLTGAVKDVRRPLEQRFKENIHPDIGVKVEQTPGKPLQVTLHIPRDARIIAGFLQDYPELSDLATINKTYTADVKPPPELVAALEHLIPKGLRHAQVTVNFVTANGSFASLKERIRLSK